MSPERVFERRRLRVYVAGPISKGDTWENIINGVRWGKRIFADGMAPYIPHLDAYMTLNAGGEGGDMWKSLLEWDLEWVSCSDAFFRIAGESKGADLELEVAVGLGIPTFFEGGPAGCDYVALLQLADKLDLAGVRV